MTHESSNGKPDTETGATSRGDPGAGIRVPTTPVVKPDT